MSSLTNSLEFASVSDAPSRAGIRRSVAFAPYFANNPYQQLLRGVLELEGVEVEFMNSVEEVEREHVSGRRPVEDGQFIARLDEITRHRHPHDTEPDEAYLLRHEPLSPFRAGAAPAAILAYRRPS